MAGDSIDHQRGVRQRHAKPNLYYGLAFTCGSLLLLAAVATLLLRPMASGPVFANAVEAPTQGGRDRSPPAAVKSQPAAVVRQAEAPRPDPAPGAPSSGQKEAAPDSAGPPERQSTKAKTDPPDAQKAAPGMAVPPPEQQTARPDAVAPAAAQTSKPEPGTVVGQPEAPKPAPNAAVPPTEEQKAKPGVVATPSEAQTPEPKPGTEAVVQPLPAQNNGRKPKDPAVPQLVLPADVARKVGERVWQNETGGNRDAITAWNASEDFPSLGIGHFIWFPAGKAAPFEESFPPLLEFLRKQNVRLPAWLDKTPIPASPWTSRADFMAKINSPETKQLRQFLLDTVAGQTQFLVSRAQGAMDKILETTPDSAERAHIVNQFSRVVQASPDLYPLIDYINFKGEGTNPVETSVDKQTGAKVGWGLKQILLKMNGTTSDRKAVLGEFADAARFVLQQRIRNIPANRIYEAGWLSRVDTYRRPIVDAAASSKQAKDEPSRSKKPKAR